MINTSKAEKLIEKYIGEGVDVASARALVLRVAAKFNGVVKEVPERFRGVKHRMVHHIKFKDYNTAEKFRAAVDRSPLSRLFISEMSLVGEGSSASLNVVIVSYTD